MADVTRTPTVQVREELLLALVTQDTPAMVPYAQVMISWIAQLTT